MVMWRRYWARAPARLAAASLVLLLAALAIGPAKGAGATHSCASTGSPFGPFSFLAYEAADYRNTYAQALELAAFNALFPDLPSFALPPLETGPRSAGSTQTTAPYIPPVLLKAIAWIESAWAQADANTPYGQIGPTLVSHDCGYGIMQVTSGMQNVTGVPNLEQAMIGGHYAFNIARGAKILADKWNLAPEFRPIAGDRDPFRPEDWYFALWGYNGFAFRNHPLNPDFPPDRPPFSCGPLDDGLGHDRSLYPYQELVIGCAAHPPTRSGTPLWEPEQIPLPDLSDPAYAEPLKLENWNACSYQAICAPMDIPRPGQTPSPTPGGDTPSPSPSEAPPSPSETPATAPATVSRTELMGLPYLNVSQTSISLLAIPPALQESRRVVISNGGTGVLAWRATTAQPWIKLSRYQGVALGGDLNAVSSDLTISTDTSGLPPGTYNGAVTIDSLYAGGAPLTIQVTVANYPEGALLRGSGPEIYRLTGGLRRHVPNVPTFEALGLAWSSVLSVPDTGLAALPAGNPLPDVLATGRLVRGGGPEVYVMESGLRRHVTDPEALFACGYGWDGIVSLSPATLASLPEGEPVAGPPCPRFAPAEGSLLHGSGPPVYVIKDGIRRHIPNVPTFEALSFQWGNVDALPDWMLAQLPEGQPLLDVTEDGNLLRGAGPEVYVMQAGQRRHVQSPEVMSQCGYGWDAVYTLSPGTLASIPLGATLVAPPCPIFSPASGTLLRGSGPEVYAIDGPSRRHVASPDAFLACGYRWGDVNRVADTVIAALPPGPPVEAPPCP